MDVLLPASSSFAGGRDVGFTPSLDVRKRNPDLIGPYTSLQGPMSLGAPGPSRHTTTPYVTGTSVVALKFNEGVMLAADTLGSYGTLARFMHFERIKDVGGGVLLGASGDLSDVQWLWEELEGLRTKESEAGDGHTLTGRALWAYLTRLLYARRNKGDPLYTQLIIADMHADSAGGVPVPFLAQADLHGTAFVDDTLATGYGAALARPILRNEYRPDMSRADARRVLESCMRVLFYRDCKTINRIQFATVTAKGCEIEQPVELTTSWEIGNRAPDKRGSW